MPPYEVG